MIVLVITAVVPDTGHHTVPISGTTSSPAGSPASVVLAGAPAVVLAAWAAWAGSPSFL